MSQQEQQAYRGIMKGTAIFGGVQIFQMLIGVIRGKFIALFLGPAGMGVSALLTSTINAINQVSSLGLNMGAVRDISMAHQAGDVVRLSKVAKIFRRLVLFTGIAGALIAVAGAYWWSEIAFGSSDYTWAFVLLGAMSFFTALASGETALLQGTRQLKDLAKTSLLGSVVGLVVGVPMYYFWGTAGIAPALVALALSTYVSNRFFSRKIDLVPVVVAGHETKLYAKQMISLGVTLTVAGVLGTLSIYLINWFIRYQGGLDDVGLYQAATSITTQYVGFIFAAMGVDYFPRLAAISSDNVAVSRTANQQGEIVLLMITPIVIALLATAPLIIRILLSEEFLSTIPLLRWMGAALFFKAASFALGYIAFAKGDKRVFFWFEGVLGNALNIIFSVVGYLYLGFMGLGVAMLANYVVYFVLVGLLASRRYGYRFDRAYIKTGLFLFLCTGATFLLTFVIQDNLWYGIVAGVIGVGVGYYCYRELDRRMHLKELIRSKFGRKNE